MPNPLSKVLPHAPLFLANVGDYPLKHNEHLARLAMEGIASWANVESIMLRLYLILAGGPEAQAAAVFLSIESDGARKSAIAALADLALDDEQKKLFRAMLKVIERRSKARHKLAHWIWGFSPALPDALLLADPRMRNTSPALTRPIDSSEAFDAYAKAIYDHVYVYTEQDFLKIVRDNDKAAGMAHSFTWIIEGHPMNANGRLSREIAEEPEIAEILNPPDRYPEMPPSGCL